VSEVGGYVPGEQPVDGGYVKLNTNENPFPPSPRVIETLQAAVGPAIKRYPQPTADGLRDKIAEVYGFAQEEIIVTNGMDELLNLVVRTFVEPDDTVVLTYPTYVLYETLARLHGASTVSHELEADFSLPGSLFNAADGQVVFLSRPNSPTGNVFDKARVADLAGGFNGLVAIDEAYVDFAEDDCLDFARQNDNVIVMRTFSKSFSLAGLRVGFGVANREIIAGLMKVKDSYNVNVLSQAAAIAALDDYEYMVECVEKVKATRDRLTSELRSLGFDALPSQSNFVLATPDKYPLSARDVYLRLKERKIIVRFLDMRRLDNSVRISVGTDEETDQLLAALKDLA
jgi:histidinol-phosphate aminotransferase